MADELSEKWDTLNLDDDNADVVNLGAVDASKLDDRVSLMLVGILLTDRGFNGEAFKRTMMHAW